MQICAHCQHQNNPTAKFCGQCGKPLAVATTVPATEWACPTCGKSNLPTKKFCTACGGRPDAINDPDEPVLRLSPQASAPAAPSPAARPATPGAKPAIVPVPEKDRSLWWWLIGGLAIVVGAVVAMTYGMTFGKKELPASQAAAAPEDLASKLGNAGGVVDSSNAPAVPAVAKPPAEKPASAKMAVAAPPADTPPVIEEPVASKPSKPKVPGSKSLSEGSPVIEEEGATNQRIQREVATQKAAMDSATERLRKEKERMLREIQAAGNN